MTPRLAALTVAALLALPASPAHAAPSRVNCEQVARQAANRAAKPNTAAWYRAWANAYAACAARHTPTRLPTTTGNRYVVPGWLVS